MNTLKILILSIFFHVSSLMTPDSQAQLGHRFDIFPWQEVLHQTIQYFIYNDFYFVDPSYSKDQDSIYLINYTLQNLEPSDSIFKKINVCYPFEISIRNKHAWHDSHLTEFRTDEYSAQVIKGIPDYVNMGIENREIETHPVFLEFFSPFEFDVFVVMPVKMHAIQKFAEIDGYLYSDSFWVHFNLSHKNHDT